MIKPELFRLPQDVRERKIALDAIRRIANTPDGVTFMELLAQNENRLPREGMNCDPKSPMMGCIQGGYKVVAELQSLFVDADGYIDALKRQNAENPTT